MGTELAGRKIAIAESRELDLLSQMLEQERAVVVRCPMVAIADIADPAPVEAWIGRVIAGDCDDVIFYTGEGIRRLAGFAERAGLREAFVAALAKPRKITRGPKPVKALRELKLASDLAVDPPTTAGVIATLSPLDLARRRIGVQLYGQERIEPLWDFLLGRGAAIDPVAPYVYASAADDLRVAALIADLAGGDLDAIAFTSAAQVDRLFDVARRGDRLTELEAGLEKTAVAAVGPVVAAALEQRGVIPTAVAPSPFSLKPLVRTIAELF